MQLTSEQRLAIKQGQPVSVRVDDIECVIVRKDVYERIQNALDPGETYAAIEAVLDQEKDPGLESYQHYKTR